jgi:signal transduction histidine kinase
MRARLEAAGGRTEIASRPGQGTTVRFHLPPPPPE